MFGRRRAPNLTRGVVRGRGTSATTSSTASSAYTKKYGGLFIFERERHRILEHMETDAVFDDEEAALEEAEKYTKSEMTTALRDRGIEVTDQLDALSIENVESQKVFDMLAEYKGGAAQAYFDHQEAAIAKLEEERDTAIRQLGRIERERDELRRKLEDMANNAKASTGSPEVDSQALKDQLELIELKTQLAEEREKSEKLEQENAGLKKMNDFTGDLLNSFECAMQKIFLCEETSDARETIFDAFGEPPQPDRNHQNFSARLDWYEQTIAALLRCWLADGDTIKALRRSRDGWAQMYRQAANIASAINDKLTKPSPPQRNPFSMPPIDADALRAGRY